MFEQKQIKSRLCEALSELAFNHDFRFNEHTSTMIYFRAFFKCKKKLLCRCQILASLLNKYKDHEEKNICRLRKLDKLIVPKLKLNIKRSK